MWPWAHVALGYLLYTLYLRLRTGEQPTGAAVIAVVFGTQLPDLIDKPLAWELHVLEYGRSLAHSFVTGTLILGVIVWYLHRRGRDQLGVALAIGYYSHFLGDAYYSILSGQWGDLAFLVWPLLPIPGVATETEGILAHLLNIRAEPFFLFGVVLTGVAFAVWLSHGRPGLGLLRKQLV
jgi:hypothetical protein